MDNDIYKDYSDEKLNKTFAYYKKELKYAERTGRQSIIDTYNAIKDEIARRKTLAGQDKVENDNNSFEKEENRKKNDSHKIKIIKNKCLLWIIHLLGKLRKLKIFKIWLLI